MLTVKILGLGFGRNRGQVTEVVVLTAVGDGFEVFRITPMGDPNTGDLPLFCHIHSLLFFHNRVVRKLIPGNPAAFLDKTDDALCVGIHLRDLIQSIFDEIVFFHFHLSFAVVFYKESDLCV